LEERIDGRLQLGQDMPIAGLASLLGWIRGSWRTTLSSKLGAREDDVFYSLSGSYNRRAV
jgi:hypothetical protein